MRDFWSLALSWGKAFANWYWGGLDGLISSLAAFVLMAHITDGMCTIVDHRPLSKAWIQDVFKTILIFVLVGVGNILDTNVLTSTPALRMTIILYYLSVEGLIILENAAHMGLPVPERLREVLERLRQNRIGSE
ncbi:MAG: phage holin family protein [Oscillospiraceae bacterium]|nr:phage holin family protein [Oscillospiraceae bacterium]